MSNQLDFTPVLALLKDAYNTCTALDGEPWDDSSANDAEKAKVSRQLGHVADQLLLASTLVRTEYWIGKGFPDVTLVNGLEERE